MDFCINRRTLLAATGLALAIPTRGRAAPRKNLKLELVSRDLALRPGQKAMTAWRFGDDAVPRFMQGDEVDVTIANRLPAEVFITWRGLDGAPALEPLLARGPIAAGGSETFALNLRHAGTLICDARLTRNGVAAPLPLLPIVVGETTAPAIDRDEVLLIEDWRVRPDGSAMPPGIDPAGIDPIYTVNGAPRLKIAAKAGERLRLRFINGAQRTVIAIQLSNMDVQVIAIDGQPSEPFPARESRLVMVPGTRIDAIVDATGGSGEITLNDGVRSATIGEIAVFGETRRLAPVAPSSALPSNGLPEKLPLQSALRIDLKLDAASGWLVPSALSAVTTPAFRVARGRPVVLALTNPTDATAIFRLHGHHMRLLDRLDDGWKPFWLDTLAIPAKQTVRVAFGATTPGAYLMEMCGTDWAATTMLHRYSVDS